MLNEGTESPDYKSKIVGMLGFARRAGKVTFGFDACVKDMRDNKAKAVFISNDASDRTFTKMSEECKRLNVRSAVFPFDKEILGRAIGRDGVAVAAVTDKSFADRLLELARLSEDTGDK